MVIIGSIKLIQLYECLIRYSLGYIGVFIKLPLCLWSRLCKFRYNRVIFSEFRVFCYRSIWPTQ